MAFIINPGSGPVEGGNLAQAWENAKRWLREAEDENVHDLEIAGEPVPTSDGRWIFNFRHKITGVVVRLSIHGLTDNEVRAMIFPPRVYWGGSSTGTPSNEDFLKDGYTIRIVKKIKTFSYERTFSEKRPN